jgi:hypothetical protein
MKKFFLKPLCLGIIVGIAVLAGCQNPFEPPKEISASQGKGRVEVSIGGIDDAATPGYARTIAPDAAELNNFTKYTLSFTGPTGTDPVSDVVITSGRSHSLELGLGDWTITAVGSTGTEDDGYVDIATGSGTVTVSSHNNAALTILLGPNPSGAQGTFSYSVTVPSGLSTAEFKIIPESDSEQSITLSYPGTTTGTANLAPGQYLVRIRLEKTGPSYTRVAGFTEVLHIYSGLTSALLPVEFTDDDFKMALDDLDLSNMFGPVAGAEPFTVFAGNSQYAGVVEWKEEDGSTPVDGLFSLNRVYKAVVTLTPTADYTIAGTARNSFTSSVATEIVNNPDSGVVTLTFPATSIITINSVANLADIGVAYPYPLGGTYKLTQNLTLSNWVPIGNDATPFFGSFDGDGRTITLTGFDSSVVSTSRLGIFGYVKGDPAQKAEIKNLTIESQINQSSAPSSTGQTIGTLAGYAENTEIEGITLHGALTFGSTRSIVIGGIVGHIQVGTVVKNSNVTADLDIAPGNTGGGFTFAGGVVGRFVNGGEILNCHNEGDIQAFSTATGSQIFAGGITGGSNYAMNTAYHGKIEDCSYTGDLHAKALGFWVFAGGIAGTIVGGNVNDINSTTRIVRSFATGTISVAGTSSGWPYIGGIVGYNYFGALVSQSYFTGNVIADKATDYTGGIAGYNSRTATPNNSRIEDCWSSGTVTGFNNAGGIVGQNQIDAYVRRCYSTATIITTNAGSAGGIAGSNNIDPQGEPGVVTNCVALNPLIQAGNIVHRVIGGGGSTENINNLGWTGMSLTTNGTYTPDSGANARDGAEIAVQPSQDDYVALGWDFGSVWTMDIYGYPKLRWQTTDTPRLPLMGPVPVVSVVNYNHYDTATSNYTTNAGGKLMVSWEPVLNATSYDIYYAPRETTAPEFLGATTGATNITGTSAEITGTAIGENTMNYYVWIRANDSEGASTAPSPHTSTMDYFLGGSDTPMGIWHTGYYDYDMDYYTITNADVAYLVWDDYGMSGFIRAITPVPNIRDYIDRDGPGGVIIFEYNRDYMDSSPWMLDSDDDEDDYFSAMYYYAQRGTDDSPVSMYMGAASHTASLDAQGDCEVKTLEEAFARFTYNNIRAYYSFNPGVEARYSFYEE